MGPDGRDSSWITGVKVGVGIGGKKERVEDEYTVRQRRRTQVPFSSHSCSYPFSLLLPPTETFHPYPQVSPED